MSLSAWRTMIVTGLSGAGKSSTLRVLEDLGYEAIDNLPFALLGSVADMAAEHLGSSVGLAIGIDARTRGFDPQAMVAAAAGLRARNELHFELLYLDCDSEVLARRFTETRRRHPLALDRPVADGIARERHLMAPLRDAADLVIDTTDLPVPDLRRHITQRYAPDESPRLHVDVMSFSYKRGLPREADLVFDVRFLQNPYYVSSLKRMTGERPEVQAYVSDDPAFADFFAKLTDLLGALLPRYGHEGKSYLTIAIGCTGGMHRSVFVASRLAQRLLEGGYKVALRHRDMQAGV
ncbi:RNase adapter RapZ [Desertibaculum subflavum]|uniref:RNase adapter RapZ n=1 Tax=Desertibaculum subflavum TaxID=2268458 RepID=UPI0034D27DC9